MAYTVIQKDRTRYTFIPKNGRLQCIFCEDLLASGLGASAHYEYVSKEDGNKFYIEKIKDGFKKFKSVESVSWYATVADGYVPCGEHNWETEGIYLIKR